MAIHPTVLLLTTLFAFPEAPIRDAASDAVPRPEHPLPQMERTDWLNLNGRWEFAETDDDRDESFLTAATLPDRIVVPFCRESKLSGLARTGFVRNVWYRRSFELPATWRSPRTILHVGACDYRTRVWLNGRPVGRHTGGSASFAFEITRLLRPDSNVVCIHAFDDTRSGLQAGGKQCHDEESNGCFYTRTTGIWQTVWLEGVGASYLRDVSIVPDPDNSRALLQVEVDGACAGLTVAAKATIDGKLAGEARTPAAWRNGRLVLDLKETRLWSVETPALYDLELSILRGDEPVDRVKSYFGLRSVTIEGRALLLNGKAVFQRLVLDQGYYPDGIWTAPTDAALRRDIELSKAAGFNGARLHQKVFEPRFLWWADRLGYIAWGEFASWGIEHTRHEVDIPFLAEWVEVVRRDRNHPSIIAWCPANETPETAATLHAAVVSVTRAIDPTRPVIESSGGTHALPDPDILDVHDYDGDPASLRERWLSRLSADVDLPARYGPPGGRTVPFANTEYGGIGWYEEGAPAWSYGNAAKTLDEVYSRYSGLTEALLDNRCFFGFTYTQLTDVEQERNGIYYYDRRPKFDAARLRAINSRRAAYEVDPPTAPRSPRGPWRVLVGAVPDGELSRPWRFTTDAEPPAGWLESGFQDAAWQTGRAGFGATERGAGAVRTPWNGSDLWLRQEFRFDGARFESAALVVRSSGAAVVLVNGAEVWKGEDWDAGYAGFDVTEAAGKALRVGPNAIAVHCHDEDGDRFLDVGLLLAGVTALAPAEDWPCFRGPSRQGVSTETGLPLRWSATEGVLWKTPIPGESWSSPIVRGDRVFITTATEEGRSCRVISLEAATGKVLWDEEVLRQVPGHKNGRNTHATPTPATDGERVYAVFGDGSFVAVDYRGSVVWTNRDFPFRSEHGLGTSPILWEGLLIMARDGSGDGADERAGWQVPWDKSFVLALDAKTGEVRWKSGRGLSRIAHVVPNIWTAPDGKVQVVSGAGDVVQGFDARTGERLWTSRNEGEGVVPSIVLGEGLAFTASGFGGRESIKAFRLGGKGDLGESNLAWEERKGTPKVPSFLYLAPHLYAVTDGGVATCIEGATGKVVWQSRIGGEHAASPVGAEGRVYFLSADGETTVVKAGPTFEVLASNPLGEPVQASMAVSGRRLYIRSARHLWCISSR